MRRIKRIDETLSAIVDRVEGLSDKVNALQREYKDIYELIVNISNGLSKDFRNADHELAATVTGQRHRIVELEEKLQTATDSLKKLSDNLVATQVRMSRFENPPKFKEGDEVEEKQMSPLGPLGFVMTHSGTQWIPRRGTVTSFYYKNPEDVLVTYRIITDARDVKAGEKTIPFRDVFELPENRLKLSTIESGEKKKVKK